MLLLWVGSDVAYHFRFYYQVSAIRCLRGSRSSAGIDLLVRTD